MVKWVRWDGDTVAARPAPKHENCRKLRSIGCGMKRSRRTCRLIARLRSCRGKLMTRCNASRAASLAMRSGPREINGLCHGVPYKGLW